LKAIELSYMIDRNLQFDRETLLARGSESE